MTLTSSDKRIVASNVKVLNHGIWWNRKNIGESTKYDVQEIQISYDTVGKYFLTPLNKDNNEQIYTYRTSWEEIDLVKIGNEKYIMRFLSVSSPHVRSETPFLTIEISKQDIKNWKEKDVWFRKEKWYFVREEGKKLYGEGTSKRCIKCHYLVGANSEECDRCN